METHNTLNLETFPDRPEPSHFAESEARTSLHEDPIGGQPSTSNLEYPLDDDPRAQLLGSLAKRINQIIESAKTLFREGLHRPDAPKARKRRSDTIVRVRNRLDKHWNWLRRDIVEYNSACNDLRDPPAEWTRGWSDLAANRYDDFVQHTICAVACQWECEERCRVSYPLDFQSRRARPRSPSKSPRVAVTSKPNPSRVSNPITRPPIPQVGPSAHKHSIHAEIPPVDGCAVMTNFGGALRHGTVVGMRGQGKNSLVEVAWGRGRKVGVHMPSELTSGFQVGDTVQEIPKSNTRTSRGTGKVVGEHTVAGETLIFVKFHGTGEIDDIPFTSLRRVIDVEDAFGDGGGNGTDSAGRFRLRCLAYGLESWNDHSGALEGLPVDPMPHQIHIVHRIMTSDQTNWLIADDVGLGKTIEVGLLLAAKNRQRTLKRVLVVCPAALTKQWQDEMHDKFNDTFEVYGPDFTIDADWKWKMKNKVIVSIDRAKLRDHRRIFESSGNWDIVIFDEAHHLSKKEDETTQRYRLAQSLRDKTDEFLFLSGTPHQGNDSQFANLLRLLRPDLLRRVTGNRVHPSVVAEVVLKNRKDTVIDMNGNPVFFGQCTRRREAGVSFVTKNFHRQLENYLRDGYAASETGDSQRRAIGFVMTTYRKLASSSIYAIEQSLKRRRDTLSGALPIDHRAEYDRLNDLRDSIDDGEVDDLESLADAEAERTLGSNPFFEDERTQLDELIRLAELARAHDLKLKLFLDEIVHPIVREGRSILVFTEYRATQEYLVTALMKRYLGRGIERIHGGMSLDDKRESIRRFNDDATFMVSTEAGGEGINLQEHCNTLVNYDIPWNPRRLVQRAGRLYRYGQKRRVYVYNLAVEDSFDNTFLSRMLGKVDAMAETLSKVDDRSPLRQKTEIMGALYEHLDVSGDLGRNTEMDRAKSDELGDKAIERTRLAKKQHDELFANVEGYDEDSARSFRLMSSDDVLRFVEGMLPEIGAADARRSQDRKVLEFKLPDEHIARFEEFGRRKTVRVTADRTIRRHLSDVAQIDFRGDFLRYLIDKAKSPEFLGQVASFAGNSEATSALFRIRWKDGQGNRKWTDLLPVMLMAGEEAPTIDHGFFEKLHSRPVSSINRQQTSDKDARIALLNRMRVLADDELRRRSTAMKRPDDIVLLAAADIVSED